MRENADILGVAFDMDGLMFDSEPVYYEISHRLLLSRGKTMTQELANAMMGLRRLEALGVMRQWHGLEDSIDALADERDRLYRELIESSLRPMPGLLDLLAALHRAGIPRCVATSAPRAYAEQAIARWSLEGSFSFVLAAEDVTRGKPDPEIYLTAAARMGIGPERMLVLEDSQTGLRAAKNAGARCVVVPHDFNSGHDFVQADAIVPTLHAPQLLTMLGCAGESP